MKFVDGLMIHSGDPVNDYVDMACRHVLLRQGVLGIKVKIMLPWDPADAWTLNSTSRSQTVGSIRTLTTITLLSLGELFFFIPKNKFTDYYRYELIFSFIGSFCLVGTFMYFHIKYKFHYDVFSKQAKLGRQSKNLKELF